MLFYKVYRFKNSSCSYIGRVKKMTETGLDSWAYVNTVHSIGSNKGDFSESIYDAYEATSGQLEKYLKEEVDKD